MVLMRAEVTPSTFPWLANGWAADAASAGGHGGCGGSLGVSAGPTSPQLPSGAVGVALEEAVGASGGWGGR